MASQVLIVSIVVLVCLFQQQTSAFQFTDCSGKNALAKLGSVKVSSCPDASGDRCIFPRGTNVTLTVGVMPTQPFKEAKISIAGKLGPIYIPFQMQGPTDACFNYGFKCPAEVGKKDVMQLSLPILSVYPNINVRVRLQMHDHNDMITCFEFPVQIN